MRAWLLSVVAGNNIIVQAAGPTDGNSIEYCITRLYGFEHGVHGFVRHYHILRKSESLLDAVKQSKKDYHTRSEADFTSIPYAVAMANLPTNL